MITAAEARRYWLAAMTVEPITYEGKEALFIEHLQRDCEDMARESGDFQEDLVAWWNSIVAWLVDNWKTVLQVVLSLLVILETP